MNPSRPFELIYAPIVMQHLKAIEPKYHPVIRQALEEQLRYEPDAETRNRKPLKRPVVFGARWELRFGPNNRFRVFYRVSRDTHEVFVLAVGEKVGSRLLIGGEEIEL